MVPLPLRRMFELRHRAIVVLRRWRPPDAGRPQVRRAVFANLAPAALALGAYLLLPVRGDWSEPLVIAALAAIAAVAFFAEVRLKVAEAFFSATIICALVALFVGGPLPALVVWLTPDLVNRLVLRRVPVLTPGLVANVASFALALLVGEGILQLAAAPSELAELPALYVAGLAMWTVNFLVARLCFAPFYHGYRVRSLIRSEFVALAPEVLAMLLVGVLTALALPVMGVFALAPLAGVILLPQFAVERLAATSSVRGLEPAEATKLYTRALADVLAMPRGERRELDRAAQILTGSLEADALVLLPRTPTGVSDAAFIAWHATERWDGRGWPAGLPAEATPSASRVLAVAHAWSELTACGTVELTHTEALLGLAARAGSEFDPAIVEAAVRVVAEEEGFVGEPSFQPRLHRLPLPRSLRRGVLPAIAPRFLAQ